MQKHNPFIDYVLERMQPLGPVRARAMFGGHGIYIDGLMFALVADDVLYLKTGANNLPDYEQRGLARFSYQRGARTVVMSYSEAPAEIFDDADAMALWAGKAVEAALQNARVKK